MIINKCNAGESQRLLSTYTIEEISSITDKEQIAFYSCAHGLNEVSMNTEDAAFLVEMLKLKGKCNIVELGRNYGCSTRVFVHHVVTQGGTFESWDLIQRHELLNSFSAQGFVLEDTDGECRFRDYPIRLCVADTQNSVIEPDGKWVDFLLIDAEHSRNAIVREYNRWKNHLKPNAIVIFHDSDLPEVKSTIEAIKETENVANDYEGEFSGGLGIRALEVV